jgi:hypothetical protein
MSEEFVSLKQLAEELGLDRSNIRKYVIKRGFHPHSRRTAESKGQPTLALTAEEAEHVRAMRREEGFLGSTKMVAKEVGFFYVVRLVPELDPRRIKLGFADNVSIRLSQHKTAAPTAVLVRYWPCKRSWELAVIDCLTAVRCRLVLNEVYECEDVDSLMCRGDQLFALLPHPEQRAELSEHSPYNRDDLARSAE